MRVFEGVEKAQRELDLVYASLKCFLAEIRRSDWATKEREAVADYGDSLRKGVDRFISLMSFLLFDGYNYDHNISLR